MSFLAAILAALVAGVGGLASCGGPTTPDPGDEPLVSRLVLDRTGGFAPVPGGERWAIDDPATIQGLVPLVPSPLPPSEPEPEPTGCADCFEYRLEIDTADGTFVGAYDDVSLPPDLRPLVDAVTGLEPTGPAEPLPPSVPPPVDTGATGELTLRYVGFLRLDQANPGGQLWSVSDEEALAELAALLPSPLPPGVTEPPTCAGCVTLVLQLDTSEGSFSYTAQDTDFPAELRPLVDAITALPPLSS